MGVGNLLGFGKNFPSNNSEFKISSGQQLRKKVSNVWLKKKAGNKFRFGKEEKNALALRRELGGLLSKRKYITEKTLEKDLYKAKVPLKDRKRIIKALSEKFGHPDNKLSQEKRERIKKLNIAMYNVQRDREEGAAGVFGSHNFTQKSEHQKTSDVDIGYRRENSKISALDANNHDSREGFAGSNLHSKKKNESSVSIRQS